MATDRRTPAQIAARNFDFALNLDKTSLRKLGIRIAAAAEDAPEGSRIDLLFRRNNGIEIDIYGSDGSRLCTALQSPNDGKIID